MRTRRASPVRFSLSTGVAFVRHGAAALLAFGKKLFGFKYFGALHVADLNCDVLDGGGDDAEAGEKSGGAVRGG